jgi:hypothetical protein
MQHLRVARIQRGGKVRTMLLEVVCKACGSEDFTLVVVGESLVLTCEGCAAQAVVTSAWTAAPAEGVGEVDAGAEGPMAAGVHEEIHARL